MLRTAVAMLEQGGDLSMRGLATALGVAAPTLYNYVASKGELLEAIRLHAFERLVARVRPCLDEMTPRLKLHAMTVSVIEFGAGEPCLYLLLTRDMDLRTCSGDEDRRRRWSTKRRQFYSWSLMAITGSVAGSDDVERLYTFWWWAVHGAASRYASRSEWGSLDADDRRAIASYARWVVRGIVGHAPLTP